MRGELENACTQFFQDPQLGLEPIQELDMKIGRVQFIKSVSIPHYNTVEGLHWRSHNHELDMDFDGMALTIRGMPERLKGRLVEVMVPVSNIAGFLSMDAELEWTREDERRLAQSAAREEEASGYQGQEARNSPGEDARSQPESTTKATPRRVGRPKKIKGG